MSTTTDRARARRVPRLKQRYREEIAPALRKEFTSPTSCRSRGLTKIVVNMGVGEAARDSKLIDGAVRDLATITGQKPEVTRARKSIAQFKLREGMPIGCHVTLRGDRMWEFADRLLTLALPRIRDFRGLSPPVRRPGQLHVRAERAGHVPRDRPGPDRPRRGAWTSRSSPPPTNDERAGRCCGTWASRSRRPEPHGEDSPQVKQARKPKFGVRAYTRCQKCGRPKAVYRKFGLCRVCVREMAHKGELPGITKTTW